MVDDSAPRGASVTPSTASPSSSPSSSSDSTPPQNKNVDDEADKARAYLRAVVTGEDLNLTEESRDFIVPLSSFVTLCDEPEFESDRKR